LTNEPRKATDVLLELETKVDILLNLVRNQDLNMKVLSNKINSLLAKQTQQVQNVAPAPVTVEAVNTATIFGNVPETPVQIPISSEDKLPLENRPKGFRRTSRPETYAGDNSYLPSKTIVSPKFPVQVPKSEVIIPAVATQQQSDNHTQQAPTNVIMNNSIPVQQRVVDKNSKSVFLADVEVFKAGSGDRVFKGRTNGTGKWMASLAPDTYKVVISKRESLTKEKVELTQEIVVDGKTSPLDLPILIFK
jgi:hypothetical protein